MTSPFLPSGPFAPDASPEPPGDPQSSPSLRTLSSGSQSSLSLAPALTSPSTTAESHTLLATAEAKVPRRRQLSTRPKAARPPVSPGNARPLSPDTMPLVRSLSVSPGVPASRSYHAGLSDLPRLSSDETSLFPPVAPRPRRKTTTHLQRPMAPRPRMATSVPPGAPLEAKIVLLGSQGVGKTSLLHRYTTDAFSSSITSTIGASFLTKKLSIGGSLVRLQLWDTAGQERFRGMAPLYYRGALAAIVVYDISDRRSFEDVRGWMEELIQNMSSDLIIQVVGAKSDLAHKRQVTLQEAQRKVNEWAREITTRDVAGPGIGFNRSRSSAALTSLPTGLSVSPPAPSASPVLRASKIKRLSLGSAMTAAAVPELDPTPRPATETPFIDVIETSAKDNRQIQTAFLSIASQLVERRQQIESARELRHKDSIFLRRTSPPPAPPSQGWCC